MDGGRPAGPTSRVAPPRVKTLVLVGNPNVGKSVLFHRLTGRYATVSNYPGTTVEVSTGTTWLAGEKWRVVDTPGVNSLMPTSEDERVTRDFLLRERPDVVLNVVDSKNLRRGLALTLELVDYGLPLVVALNLADEALDRGIAIDVDRLSRRLGVPLVSTVATTGDGLPDLKRALEHPTCSNVAPAENPDIARALAALDTHLSAKAKARRSVSRPRSVRCARFSLRPTTPNANTSSSCCCGSTVLCAAKKNRCRFRMARSSMSIPAVRRTTSNCDCISSPRGRRSFGKRSAMSHC